MSPAGGRTSCDLADISADGRYIAVLSDTSDDGHRRLFVRDMMTGGLSEVSVAYDDRQPSPSWWSINKAAISADGSRVVFYSDHDRLVPDDTNATDDIFVRTLDRH